MTKIKAVIGANYGDEGKGLMTDYYCQEAINRGETAIVICSNGGGQRGHTVSTPEGQRFVFHHLGSGSFVGADTYFSKHFLVNPIIFFRDYNQFRKENPRTRPFEIFMDPGCRFSTPFDMMTNQILENARGDKRHGSVGVGIWETVRRYEKGHGITVEEMKNLTMEDKIEHIQHIRSYLEDRIIKKLGMKPDQMDDWKDIWNQENLIRNFILDFEDMCHMVPMVKMGDLSCYDNIIIENAQGLLLSRQLENGTNHTTPSYTGAREIADLLEEGFNDFAQDIQLCYVTRSYLTKHGAGEFPGECHVEEIGHGIVDETNMPHPFQGTLRYGKMNEKEVLHHIEIDEEDMVNYRHTTVICITHLNEYIPDMGEFGKCVQKGKILLISDGKTRESVKAPESSSKIYEP